MHKNNTVHEEMGKVKQISLGSNHSLMLDSRGRCDQSFYHDTPSIYLKFIRSECGLAVRILWANLEQGDKALSFYLNL